MLIYVVVAEHRAEGSIICGVFNEQPTREEAVKLARRYVNYGKKKFDKWIEVETYEYPLCGLLKEGKKPSDKPLMGAEGEYIDPTEPLREAILMRLLRFMKRAFRITPSTFE